MTLPRYLDEANCWRVSGVRSAERFFRGIQLLVPDATHVFLEGTPAPDIVAIITAHSADTEYGAPVGTIWSWPGRDRRFTLRASPALFVRLCEAAPNHAEPEICSHLHVYTDGEPLLQWFDAFVDPLLISKVVGRDRVEQFCSESGGELSGTA
jgi:hypothetical protein